MESGLDKMQCLQTAQYLHKVQYYETDRMGITHHSNYIRWMEEARIDFLEQLGWGYDRLEAMGIASPVIHVDCDYKRTTTFPDKVEISAQVETYNGVKMSIRYEMRDGETKELAAVGHSGHCFLDGRGIPVRMKRQFPELDSLLRKLAQETEK